MSRTATTTSSGTCMLERRVVRLRVDLSASTSSLTRSGQASQVRDCSLDELLVLLTATAAGRGIGRAAPVALPAGHSTPVKLTGLHCVRPTSSCSSSATSSRCAPTTSSIAPPRCGCSPRPRAPRDNESDSPSHELDGALDTLFDAVLAVRTQLGSRRSPIASTAPFLIPTAPTPRPDLVDVLLDLQAERWSVARMLMDSLAAVCRVLGRRCTDRDRSTAQPLNEDQAAAEYDRELVEAWTAAAREHEVKRLRDPAVLRYALLSAVLALRDPAKQAGPGTVQALCGAGSCTSPSACVRVMRP